LRTAREIRRHAERWRPWRAYAAMYLWQTNGAGRVRTPPAGKSVSLTSARRRRAYPGQRTP
jgi:hypothetical protein